MVYTTLICIHYYRNASPTKLFHDEEQYSNDEKNNSKFCEKHEFEEDEKNKNLSKITINPSSSDRSPVTKLEHLKLTTSEVKSQFDNEIARQQVKIIKLQNKILKPQCLTAFSFTRRENYFKGKLICRPWLDCQVRMKLMMHHPMLLIDQLISDSYQKALATIYLALF